MRIGYWTAGAAMAAFFLLPGPARAQGTPPPAGPPQDAGSNAAEEPPEEIVIIGRRRPTPDFQEQYEFHKAEFERLRQIYEEPPPPPRYSPGERKLRVQESISSTLPGKPTLLDRAN